MSIPLVQNNEKDSINTSIIAIKRQIERINALLGLSNSEEIDTSVFATKTELEDAVTQVETDLAPVDEVTADNMQSVTSNAVAQKISSLGLSVSSLKTILDDSAATLKVRTYGKIAIFTAYAKRSCTKYIDITNYEVNLGKSLKSGMTWGNAIHGEAFVSDTDPKTFVISCKSECSTEVVAFLK